MEYNLSGALALASDIETFNTTPTSILVKDNEWEEKIEYYITHVGERNLARVEHQKWIEKNRNIETQLDLLKKIYEV